MSTIQERLAAALADRYRIERELGAGGMATVYLAHDLRHDRSVAIKVLHPDLGAALGGERFLTEIRTTARLQHPHILPLLDSGEADGLLFYVMPLVTGETLRARLEREQQLPVADAVQIAREVADALGHAHALGVIHRDIKPENILLQGGHALVADFGIALAVQSAGGQRMTQTGLSLGTPQYMSPEQAMGERTVDARSDIYALGAVTYEMLAGEAPFTGPSVQAIVARLLSESPRALGAQRKSVPEYVESAVLRALEKLPADRFATAAEFAGALTGAAASGATIARLGTGRGGVVASRPAVIALAGLAAVSALLAAWGWMRTPGRAGTTGSVAFALDQTGPLGIVRPQIGEVVPVAISPDGRTLAYVVQPEGVPLLAIRRIEQPTPTVISGTENVAGGMVFAPDGRSIAFVQGRKLRRVGLDGTPPVDITDLPATAATFSINWLPGDTIYFSPDGRRAFYRVVASGVQAPIAIPFPDSVQTFSGLRSVAGTPWLLTSTLSNLARRIYAINSSTFESRELDIDATGILPTPDGRHALLVKANQALTIVPFDPKTLTLAGAEVRLLSGIGGNEATIGASLTLSPAGTLAYFERARKENRLVEVTRTGAARAIVAIPDSYKDARWSPDGTRVAFNVADGEIIGTLYVDDLRSGTRTRISPAAQDLYPLWSRDGSELFFASLRAGPIGIWRSRVESAESGRAWSAGGAQVLGHPQLITPDGGTLLYRVTGPATGTDIYAAPVDGTEAGRPILASSADELAPDLSADQRWLAYVSSESGRNEVYVTAWPGLGARRQLSSGGGDEPRWNPRGGELFYRTGDALVAVRLVERDGLPAVAGRDTLFQEPFRRQVRWAQYDVSADGQRFLFIREGARKEPVVVITNWLDGALATLRRGGNER